MSFSIKSLTKILTPLSHFPGCPFSSASVIGTDSKPPSACLVQVLLCIFSSWASHLTNIVSDGTRLTWWVVFQNRQARPCWGGRQCQPQGSRQEHWLLFGTCKQIQSFANFQLSYHHTRVQEHGKMASGNIDAKNWTSVSSCLHPHHR